MQPAPAQSFNWNRQLIRPAVKEDKLEIDIPNLRSRQVLITFVGLTALAVTAAIFQAYTIALFWTIAIPTAAWIEAFRAHAYLDKCVLEDFTHRNIVHEKTLKHIMQSPYLSEKIFKEKGLELNKTDTQGNNFLHFCHSDTMARRLLQNDVDPSKKNRDGLYPIQKAIEQNNFLLTEKLLERLDPDIVKDENFQRQSLIRVKSSKILQLLKSAGFSLNLSCNDYPLIIYYALRKREGLVYQLIELGQDCNLRSNTQQTLLHLCRSTKILERVLENGVAIDSKNYIGLTPLQKHLLEIHKNGNTPSKHSRVLREAVKLLLKKGADTSIPFPDHIEIDSQCRNQTPKKLLKQYKLAVS